MKQPSLRRALGSAFLFVAICGSTGSSVTAASTIHPFTVAGSTQTLSRPVVHGTLVAWLQGMRNKGFLNAVGSKEQGCSECLTVELHAG